MTFSTEQDWLDMIWAADAQRVENDFHPIEQAVCVDSFVMNGEDRGFQFKIFAPCKGDEDQRFMLSGDVWGFDVSKIVDGEIIRNWNGGGNYGAEAWLERNGDLTGIQLDSESGNFFAYSDKAETLVNLVHTLGTPESVS